MVAVVAQFGCNHLTSETTEGIPTEMKPDWKGIDLNEMPVKFGQILRFEKDSNVINAIALDFDKDEGGIWIGLCFINKTNIFGRQIPSGWINTKCLDLLDLQYLNNEGLKQYQIIDQIKVNRDKVGIGLITPVSNVEDLMLEYKRGIEQRKKKQTSCDEGLIDEESVRECYFNVKKIELQ